MIIIVHKLYESYLLDQEMFITINDKVKITEFIINFIIVKQKIFMFTKHSQKRN